MSARARDGGPLFWTATVAGWVVIGYGLVGLVDERHRTAPASLGRWFVGGVLVHDLVWAPLALVAGAVIARLPGPWRGAAVWATFSSAVLVLVGWPFVRGYGRDPANPSLLPRDYRAGLLAYLAVTWVLAAGAALVVSQVRHRRRRSGGGSGPDR